MYQDVKNRMWRLCEYDTTSSTGDDSVTSCRQQYCSRRFMLCAVRPQSRIGVEQFTMQVHGLIGVEQSRIGDNQGLETGAAPEHDLIVMILLQNKSISSSDGVIMLSVLLRDLSLSESLV